MSEKPTTLVCTFCKKPKERAAFYDCDLKVCKPCRIVKRDTWRKENPERYKAQKQDQSFRKYGMNRVGYDALLLSQLGGCAICRKTHNLPATRFVIDHNHRTGVVRGLLCAPCNMAIGLFNDQPKALRSAARYLESRDR